MLKPFWTTNFVLSVRYVCRAAVDWFTTVIANSACLHLILCAYVFIYPHKIRSLMFNALFRFWQLIYKMFNAFLQTEMHYQLWMHFLKHLVAFFMQFKNLTFPNNKRMKDSEMWFYLAYELISLNVITKFILACNFLADKLCIFMKFNYFDMHFNPSDRMLITRYTHWIIICNL